VTRDQAKFALDQLASNGSVAIYLNGVGKAFVGSVTYDPNTGLIVIDGNRAFVRGEQVSAIAVVEEVTL
jgi:hypothetical protein